MFGAFQPQQDLTRRSGTAINFDFIAAGKPYCVE
jgi:hypothetical protein